ncbi:MAG: hypothetical protein ABEL76_02595 [Bradymonadaceae bacterium]
MPDIIVVLIASVIFSGIMFLIGRIGNDVARGGDGSFYDEFEEEVARECIVCGSLSRSDRWSACPDCGFDPENPSDAETERALTEIGRLESLGRELENLLDGQVDVTSFRLNERVDEIRKHEAVDEDALPTFGDDPMPDRTKYGAGRVDESVRNKVTECLGVIGEAKSRLEERVRQRENAASDDSRAERVEW